MISQDLHRAIVFPHGPKEPAATPPADPTARFLGWVRLWLPVGYALQATFTHNRSTLISYRRGPKEVALRLHRLFAEADPQVAQAIAHYVMGRKGPHAALKRYLAVIEAARWQTPRAPGRVRQTGAVHDLQPLFDRLNRSQFKGRCRAAITWGRSAPRRVRRRSIVLGSYAPGQNLIRVHPCLDQAFVPEYVVLGVVHHEMLHELLGVTSHGGRRRVHPPEFVAIEQMYADYQRCLAWERAHIGRLLSYDP
jgi:hypothetical protein